MTGRALARAVLERVEVDGAYAAPALSVALDRARGSVSSEDRALATELVYGVLRRRGRLDRALAPLAKRGLDALPTRALIALRLAGYQLLFLSRIPAYAAVNDAVEACKAIGGRGLAGFANAVLRRLARAGEPPFPDQASDPRRYLIEREGLPDWLASLLLAETRAADALAYAAALSEAPPLALRVNTTRIDRDGLMARLVAERPHAVLAPSPIAPDGVEARHLDAPATTESFREGLFAIQDAGAQVVVALCGAQPGERILDACAGRGGKTAHLVALAKGRAQVDAVDVAPAKLAEAAETLRRLGLGAGTVSFLAADLTQPSTDPAPRYHRILLDAPCSGLGVLRRHPEAVWRRRPDELPALAAQQLRMLRAVAPTLLPDGVLVYAVCTFDRAECEDVISAFLEGAPQFGVEPASAAGGGVPWQRLLDPASRIPGVVRTWPQRDGADAFFAVRLRKRA